MPPRSARLPGKKDVARALLLKGSVFVHLDPRRDGVVVPADYRNQPQLVLQVGLDLPAPIPDLRVDGHGVRGTLSFQRTPFTCTVPWHAVFAVVGGDGRGMVWPTSIPKEIAAEVERESARAKLASAEKASGTKGRRAVREEDEETWQRPRVDRKSGVGLTRRALAEEAATPPRREAAEAAARPRPVETSSPGSSARTGRGLRRARVLPPYLRVIK